MLTPSKAVHRPQADADVDDADLPTYAPRAGGFARVRSTPQQARARAPAVESQRAASPPKPRAVAALTAIESPRSPMRVPFPTAAGGALKRKAAVLEVAIPRTAPGSPQRVPAAPASAPVAAGTTAPAVASPRRVPLTAVPAAIASPRRVPVAPAAASPQRLPMSAPVAAPSPVHGGRGSSSGPQRVAPTSAPSPLRPTSAPPASPRGTQFDRLHALGGQLGLPLCA